MAVLGAGWLGRCRWFMALLAGIGVGPLAAAELPLLWRWSNPTPHGNTVYDMIAKFGLVFQAADSGQLYSSFDQVLWEPHDTGTTHSLRGLAFLDERLIVTGASGTILFADSLADIQTANLNPPTTDWLEGVAATSSLLVAVGDNGAVYTSTTGADWSRRSAGTTKWLTSVSVNPNGLFVAVGEGGFLATSSNGVNWTNQPAVTTAWLNKVRWLNDRFWAMGDNGTVIASVNGVFWQTVAMGATKGLFSAANNGAQYVFVGDEEVRRGQGFPLAWVNELDPLLPAPPPTWTYFAAERVDPYYLLAGRSGMLVKGFGVGSPPVFYWETHSDPLRNWLWDLIRLPDLFVAVGDFATVLTSGNGVDWELELVPNSVTNAVFLGIGGDTNGLVAVGSQGSIIYSPSFLTNVVVTNIVGGIPIVTTNEVDAIGTIWHAVDPRPTTNDLQGVTLAGGRYVATGANGTILTSDDRGTNWTLRAAPTTNFLSGAAATALGFAAVGANGTALTSVNGENWSSVASGTTNWLFRVRRIAEGCFAVGQNGTLLHSADGSTWSPRTSGTTKWLNDLTRLNDPDQTWITVGNQGTVLASTNAITWTNAGSITPKSLYAAAHNGAGLLVVAGVEGAILRSQLTPLTNPVEIVQYSRGVNQSSFLFAGQTGQRFTLDRGSAFTNWLAGDLLELLDGSGTLLYIEANPTNAPAAEFYRATLVP